MRKAASQPLHSRRQETVHPFASSNLCNSSFHLRTEALEQPSLRTKSLKGDAPEVTTIGQRSAVPRHRPSNGRVIAFQGPSDCTTGHWGGDANDASNSLQIPHSGCDGHFRCGNHRGTHAEGLCPTVFGIEGLTRGPRRSATGTEEGGGRGPGRTEPGCEGGT